MNRDPVTPELRGAVMLRDGWRCVAPQLGAPDLCAGRLTLDHVRDQPHVGDPVTKRKGRRAPSDPAHLVTLCWHHHLDGWATSHRPELREYLRQKS